MVLVNIMINLHLNNNVVVSQVKTVRDCNTELVTTDDIKQSKLENFVDTKKIELDKQSIIQLQEHIEVKETKVSITEQHPVEIIKGRDNGLYNIIMEGILRGKNSIAEFEEIVRCNKDNQVINVEDWKRVEHFIRKFQSGISWSNIYKGKDPVVNQALDLISARNEKVISTLKEYLSTKTKAPEESKIKVAKDATELSTKSSKDVTYTDNLLKWINNCLNQYDKVLNKKYNSAFLQIVELSYSKESLLVCG